MYMVNHIKDHIIQLLSKFHTGFQTANHPSSFTQSEKKKEKKLPTIFCAKKNEEWLPYLAHKFKVQQKSERLVD